MNESRQLFSTLWVPALITALVISAANNAESTQATPNTQQSQSKSLVLSDDPTIATFQLTTTLLSQSIELDANESNPTRNRADIYRELPSSARRSDNADLARRRSCNISAAMGSAKPNASRCGLGSSAYSSSLESRIRDRVNKAVNVPASSIGNCANKSVIYSSQSTQVVGDGRTVSQSTSTTSNCR